MSDSFNDKHLTWTVHTIGDRRNYLSQHGRNFDSSTINPLDNKIMQVYVPQSNFNNDKKFDLIEVATRNRPNYNNNIGRKKNLQFIYRLDAD